MFTKSDIHTHCGQVVLTLCQNRHRGGQSAAKGQRYEDFFATYLLLKHLWKSIYSQQFSTRTLHSQFLSVIDDLGVEDAAGSPLELYQLKNVQSITWRGGEHPLLDDFLEQDRLCRGLGIAWKGILVLSNSELADDMRTNLPTPLVGFTRVRYFPWLTALPLYVNEIINGIPIKDLLDFMLADADDARRDALLRALLSYWCADTGSLNIAALHQKLLETPGLLVRSPVRVAVPSEVLAALTTTGLHVQDLGGYLAWDYPDFGERGIIPFHMDSPKFQVFADWVLRQDSLDYDRLLGWIYQ